VREPSAGSADPARDGLGDGAVRRPQLDVVGDEQGAHPDRGGARGRMRSFGTVVGYELGSRHPRFERLEAPSPQPRELAVLGPQRRLRIEEDGDSERLRDPTGDARRQRFRALPRESSEGNQGKHVHGADPRMDAPVMPQIDSGERPLDEARRGLDGRAWLRHRREDAAIVGFVAVPIQEPDTFARAEGVRDVVHSRGGTALADVRNQLQELHGLKNTTIPGLMAVYFHEEIVPGVSAPRSEILDRRETDFKAGEIVVRHDDNPEAPPKSFDLLRQGEDLYSRGLYHQAIHVWTRVLFLDRGNADARLRIDKAKEVIAERERRLDVEIAEAKGLFESGQIQEARERVRSVLSADGSHSEAVQLEAAIEALDRRNEPPRETPREADRLTAQPTTPAKGVVFKVPKSPKGSPARSGRPVTSRFKMTAFLLVALLLFAASLFYLRENWDAIVSDGAYGHPPGLTHAVPPDRLAASVPDLSQLRYYNGERLFAQGRYLEALAELRLVDRDSNVISEARSLILRIEDRLLRGATEPEPAIDGVR